jgi:hypothetical protein
LISDIHYPLSAATSGNNLSTGGPGTEGSRNESPRLAVPGLARVFIDSLTSNADRPPSLNTLTEASSVLPHEPDPDGKCDTDGNDRADRNPRAAPFDSPCRRGTRR